MPRPKQLPDRYLNHYAAPPNGVVHAVLLRGVCEVRVNATSDRFTSYACNHEDVLLWRVLRSVVAGTYVDIGAFDPELDSVTKAFYERGWRGLNLQPLPLRLARFCACRPQDINLGCTVGESLGILRFYSVDNQGPCSTFCEEKADRQRRSGRQVDVQTVNVRPLDELIATLGRSEINFLRLDSRFAPPGAIRALEASSCRPWLIVTMQDEIGDGGTTPVKPLHCFERVGYSQAYFNGPTRLWVRNDKVAEFGPRLALPPTTLDCFTTRCERELERQNAALTHGASSCPTGAAETQSASGACLVADLRQRNFELARRISELESLAQASGPAVARADFRRTLGAPAREFRRLVRKVRKRFSR